MSGHMLRGPPGPRAAAAAALPAEVEWGGGPKGGGSPLAALAAAAAAAAWCSPGNMDWNGWGMCGFRPNMVVGWCG